MNKEKEIQKAIADIEQGKALLAEAHRKYYSAGERLRILNAAAAPKRESKSSESKIENVIAKRNAKIRFQ